jgi:regulator of sigma D
MAIFSWLFRNKEKPEPPTSTQQKTNSSIRFRPDLVEKLTSGHRSIVIIYQEINTLFQKGDYLQMRIKLNEFKRVLQGHVIVENVQFYTYLENKLQNDATNLEFIRDVRKEMNGIAHAVVQFTKKYDKASFSDEEVKESFLQDIKEIGKVLTQRVEMEETQLYTLYEE